MNDRERFGSTMLSLSRALSMYGKELTEALQEVYWKALQGLSDDEFERAAEVLIQREKDFPPPALFLEVARPSADGAAEAFRVMCRAWWAGRTYDPEGGGGWSAELIREAMGEAAYEAFHACGGSNGFRLMDDDFHGPGIRRAFMESYQRVLKNEPHKSLPVPRTPALTSGQILEQAGVLEAPTFDWRETLRAGEAAERAKQLEAFTERAQQQPCSPGEQAKLDELGKKLAAKRAAITSPKGDTA